jgi:hypothetical protein
VGGKSRSVHSLQTASCPQELTSARTALHILVKTDTQATLDLRMSSTVCFALPCRPWPRLRHPDPAHLLPDLDSSTVSTIPAALSSASSNFGSPATSVAGAAPIHPSLSVSRQQAAVGDLTTAHPRRSRLGQEVMTGGGGLEWSEGEGSVEVDVYERSDGSADDDVEIDQGQTSSGDEVEVRPHIAPFFASVC